MDPVTGVVDEALESKRCHALIGLLGDEYRFVGSGAKRRAIDVFFSWFDPSPGPRVPPSALSRIPLPVSPFIHRRWVDELRDHPDRLLVALFLDQIRHGASLAFAGNRSQPVIHANHASARLGPGAAWVARDVHEDIALKRTSPFFPLSALPCANARTSPIGVVAKPPDPMLAAAASATRYRRVYNGSFPDGGDSINEGCPRIFCRCDRWDTFVDLLRLAGRGCWLFKEDVQAAFRQVAIRPQDRHLVGIALDGLGVCFELCLPFGLRVSPPLWERAASTLHWVLEQHRFCCFHHVDDFVFLLARLLFPDLPSALKEVTRLHALAVSLGVPFSPPKHLPPCHVATVTGVLVDTVSMTLSITPARLARVISDLSAIVASATVTRTQLASAVGRLAFVARVFPAGRSFYSRALSLLREIRFAKLNVLPVTDGIRADCDFWLTFLPRAARDGGSVAIPEGIWDKHAHREIFTDACGEGYGVWYPPVARPRVVEPGTRDPTDHGTFIRGIFSALTLARVLRVSALSMPTLELYALVIAARAFGHLWAGQRIIFRCDCLPVVHCVNRGLSRNDDMTLLLRVMSITAVTHRFEFRARHIAGIANSSADALSRGRQDVFLKLWWPTSPSQLHPPRGTSIPWGLPF